MGLHQLTCLECKNPFEWHTPLKVFCPSCCKKRNAQAVADYYQRNFGKRSGPRYGQRSEESKRTPKHRWNHITAAVIQRSQPEKAARLVDAILSGEIILQRTAHGPNL